MQFCNSKEGLTQLLQDNLANPYKRRKRIKLDASEQPSSISPQNDDSDDDMEIQNSDDESDQPVQFPSAKSASTGTDLDESNSNNLSGDALQLSLLELKQKQEEILRALENESSDSNSNATAVNQDGTPNNDTETNDQEKNNTNDTNENPPVETANNDTIQNVEPIENDAVVNALDTSAMEPVELIKIHLESSVPNTPSPSMAGQSRKAMFGTPIIQQVSPFSKLPTGEKWSVGVSDVIDFENLPDGTGTYSKLTGVIEKVRTVIKRINDDNEHDDDDDDAS